MKKRYRVLRIAVVIYKVLAVLTPIATLLRWSVLRELVFGLLMLLQVPYRPEDVIVADFIVLVSGIISAVLLWGVADLMMTQAQIEENTRATALLLRRLVQHQVPSEEPEYMRSFHGVWEDAPPARIPDEKWRRKPVTDEMNAIHVEDKHRVYRRPSDGDRK